MATGQPVRRATAADVARAVGVSRATVGYVLNDTPGQTISEATRQRVFAESRRLGYRPHQAARALASGQSRIVLLVLPDWPIDYSMRVHLDEASLVLDEAGYTLVTTTLHTGGHAQPLWDKLNADVVMGMLPFTAEILDEMRGHGVERIVPSAPLGEETVDPDAMGFAQGPRRQVEHLLERGRRRIVFARSDDPRLASLVSERGALAAQTLLEHTGGGLVADEAIDEASVTAALDRWLTAGVDGVAAYNDDIAALVAGAAVRMGIPIPARLAIIGHDDAPIARLFVPSLSSVRIDSAGLGRFLAELALAAIHDAPAPTAGPVGEAAVIHRESS